MRRRMRTDAEAKKVGKKWPPTHAQALLANVATTAAAAAIAISGAGQEVPLHRRAAT